MKTNKVYFSTILFILLLSFFFHHLKEEQSYKRFHQHLQGRPEITVESKQEFVTHLPLIEIDTQGQTIPGGRVLRLEGKLTILDDFAPVLSKASIRDKNGVVNKLNNPPDKQLDVLVRYRGHSSRVFDKKSLKLRFVDDVGNQKDVSLAGMTPNDEWNLHGPFLDRTLIRNYLGYNISGEIMDYAPNVRYCELILNGEYQGVYLIVENIDPGTGRIPLEKSDRRSKATPYILVWDRSEKVKQKLNNFSYYTYQTGSSALDIKYPGRTRLTPEQVEYISNDISRIEKILYSYDLGKYDEYLDRNSFAEYFIINEFFRNADAGKFSTYLYKDLRQKIKLCVWDFNNCCDNYADLAYSPSGFTMQDTPWFSMLLKDRKFVELVINKYHVLRKTTLSTPYLLDYIDDTRDFLGPSIDRNNDKWGYVFLKKNRNPLNYLLPYKRNMKSYDESIEQLKGFITRRGEWLDQNIESLYQYCAPSKNSNTLLDPGGLQ
ncbi:MAG: CotH kinase family protein [Filifactor alocis]|nr:CotH kinase family protein [Filifactor alocis]